MRQYRPKAIVRRAFQFLIAFFFLSGIQAQKPQEYTIISTTSYDYSDLVFLDSLVLNKQIVFLGESHHGIEDFNEMKFRMIRYLHEKHDFNLVVFEAGVHEAAMTNILKDSLNSLEMLTQSLMGYWRTESNCAMMKYISDNQIDIAGMDGVSHALPPKEKHYSQIYENKELADKFFKLDSLFHFGYLFNRLTLINGQKESIMFEMDIDSLAQHLLTEYKNAGNELRKSQVNNLELLQWANGSIIEEISETRNDQSGYFIATSPYRDSLMASNLTYALDSVYPNQKTIVWGWDGHLAKTGADYNYLKSIGAFLDTNILEQSLVISISAINGTGRSSYASVKDIELNKFNIERKYKRIESKGVYVPSGDIRLRKNINSVGALYSNNLEGMFDGFIFLRDVTGSEFIKFGAPNNCE